MAAHNKIVFQESQDMPNFLRNRFALIFALLMVSITPAVAQTYTEGSIAGTVFDPTGAVVANAAITVHNDGTNAGAHLTTDGSGYYKRSEERRVGKECR